MTKSFARIEDGLVAELLATAGNIHELFHPTLAWVDITDRPQVTVGWSYDGKTFSPPTPVTPPEAPTFAHLQTQLQAIQAQLASMGQND